MPKSYPDLSPLDRADATGPGQTPDPHRLFDDDDDSEVRTRARGDERPTRAPRARLVVTNGRYVGKVVILGAEATTIGRSSKCELPLKGCTGVSRRHCKVQLLAGHYVVTDLDSRNGTLVNGEPVHKQRLADGDLLDVGDEKLRFLLEADFNDAVSELPTELVDPSTVYARSGPRGGRPERQPPVAYESAPPLLTEERRRAGGGPTSELPLGMPSQAMTASRRGAPLDAPTGALGTRAEQSLPSEPGARPATDLGLMHGLLVVALLIVALLGVIAWDIARNNQRLLTSVRQVFVAPAPSKDQPAPDRTPEVKGELDAPRVEDAATQDQASTDALAAERNPATVPEAVLVTSSTAGRLAAVRVAVGDRITKGQTVATVEANSILKKKLDTLREEERAFREAVAKGNATARRDLEAVQQEIADIASRARATSLTSITSGEVVEVFVAAGDTIRTGQPLVKLKP